MTPNSIDHASGFMQPSQRTPEDLWNEISSLFGDRGTEWYGGEAVSQLQHALQAAKFAEDEEAPPSLIIAALLHDIGHLLHDLPEDAASEGIDDAHERRGTEWLTERFVPAVVEPVGMHVDAKRYLCATDAAYQSVLSPASQQSLRLQGGPMSPDEVRQFEDGPFFKDAVRLRRWDDAAKIPDCPTPDLVHFRPYIEAVVARENTN